MAALWPARTGDDYLDIITFQRGDKTALTKNFSLYEFECPCGCTAQMIDRELVEKMQALRDKLGKKVKVTSGYRCVKHNASKDVGGSKQSRHLYGIAADWRTDNRSVNPVALGIWPRKQGSAVLVSTGTARRQSYTPTRGAARPHGSAPRRASTRAPPTMPLSCLPSNRDALELQTAAQPSCSRSC